MSCTEQEASRRDGGDGGTAANTLTHPSTVRSFCRSVQAATCGDGRPHKVHGDTKGLAQWSHTKLEKPQ